MRSSLSSLAALLLAGAFLAGSSHPLAAEGKSEAKYDLVGVKKCALCHKKDATGNQYGVWLESKHAKAYESLASEKSVAAAKKMGIADPQKAPECLKCHATAFAVRDDLANQKITLEEGVSCESCHGAGSGYYKQKTMEGLTAGEIEPASVGLTAQPEKSCVQCHTAEPEGNPFHKAFDAEAYLKKIAHPIPKS